MIINGPENFTIQLERLCSQEVSKRVVMAGAKPVADEIRNGINGLPEDTFRKLQKEEKFQGVPKDQKQDLLDSLGIAPIDIDIDGNTNTKVGFDGYGSHPTHKYPKGLPNQILARAIESGSSVRKKTPFVRKATNSSKEKAIQAMQEQLDKEIKSIKK